MLCVGATLCGCPVPSARVGTEAHPYGTTANLVYGQPSAAARFQ
jgi:hypothetical protein